MSKIMSALLMLALVMVSQMGSGQTKSTKINHPMLSQQNENVWSKLNKVNLQTRYQKTNQPTPLSEVEIYSWSGESWFTNGKVNYLYEDNQLTSIFGTVYDGFNYALSDRTTLSYLDGYLAQEIYEELNMDTNEMENVERIGYGYEDTSAGKALIIIMYSDWESSWIVSGKDEFTYADGVIASGIYYVTDNFNFIEDEKFTVSSENDSTVITYFEKSGTEWLLTEREIYPGFTPQELFNYYLNLDRSLYDLIFSYSLFTLELPDVIMQDYVENEWENSARISTDKFYEMGNDIITKLHKNFEYWNGVEWVEEEQIEIYFNFDSKVDSALVQLNLEPPVIQTYMKETFQHDSFGNLSVIISEVDLGVGLEEYMKTELRWGNNAPTNTEDDPILSTHFNLAPAYPNPFNPSTNIQFSLERAGEVSISVYDILGREVAKLVEGVQAAGSHTLQFNAQGLSSGIYYVRMTSGNLSKVRSISLVK